MHKRLGTRVIPCLLLKNQGLVKTVRFRDPKYVGDPINAVKIFNEKEVDELIFLDITATAEGRRPNFGLISSIASECFMPVCYGGGIRDIQTIKDILGIGIEKVSIGSYAAERPEFVKEAAEKFGSQSIVVCIDVKKNFFGKYEVVVRNGTKKAGYDPLAYALAMEHMGAGELLVTSVDRDGTMSGYDLPLLSSITKNVHVPVIACGGAGKLSDIEEAVTAAGASSAAAGSLFVFHGKHRAVLISYPGRDELDALFDGQKA